MEAVSPSRRSWLYSVGLHLWAFWEPRKALITFFLKALSSQGQPNAAVGKLVQRLITVGNALEVDLPTVAPGRFQSIGLRLRSQHYIFIVLCVTRLVTRLPDEFRTAVRHSDLKQVLHFGELALKYYKTVADGADTGGGARKAGDRAYQRKSLEYASFHRILGEAYLNFNSGDLGQDLLAAEEHLHSATELFQQCGGHWQALYLLALSWINLGNTLLRCPSKTPTAYIPKAVKAFCAAKEILTPYLASMERLPDVGRNREAWLQLPASTRLKYAATYAARVAYGQRRVRRGHADSLISGIMLPTTIARINWRLRIAYSKLRKREESLEHFELAVAKIEDVKERAAIHTDMGFAYLEFRSSYRKGDLTCAMNSFENVLKVRNEIEPTQTLLAVVGEVHVFLAEFEDTGKPRDDRFARLVTWAIRQLRNIIGIERTRHTLKLCQEAAFLLGRVYAMQGDHARAYRALVLASRWTDRMQHHARTLRYKHYWIGTTAPLYDTIINIVSPYFQLLGKKGKQVTEFGRAACALRFALTFSEKARTVFLRDELSNRELLPRGGAHNHPRIQALFDARRRWHRAELKLQELESSATTPESSLTIERRKRNLREKEYFQQLELVRKEVHDPDYDPDQPVRPATFSKIRVAVECLSKEQDTVLIQYHVSNSRVHVFMLFPQSDSPSASFFRHRTFRISAERIHELALHWQRGLSDAQVNRDRTGSLVPDINQPMPWIHWERGYLLPTLHHLRELAEIPQELITEWEDKAGRRIRRVVIVPHQFLHLIPFHAMELPDKVLWGDRVLIQYAPSASVLCRLLSVNTNVQVSQAATRAIIVAYSTIPIANSDSDVPPLFFHTAEAQSVQNAIGGEVLEGEAATPESLKRVIDEANYLHISCHARFDSEQSLNSALILASCSTSPGALTLGEIFESVHIPRCRLAVLSACETGLSKTERRGDEYIGFPTGLLYAGAKTVISSLWQVPDVASWLLMKTLWCEIRAGMHPGEALRSAQRALRSLSLDRVRSLIKEAALQQEDRGHREAMLQVGQTLSGEYPFAGPYWWAGFTVNGLG